MDVSCLSTPEISESRRGRKRLRIEKNWKRKKRKLDKDKGSSYTTYKGVTKMPKELKDLQCRCVFKCCQKLSDNDRKRIFDEFYRLENHDIQNKYLFGLIDKKTIKRR